MRGRENLAAAPIACLIAMVLALASTGCGGGSSRQKAQGDILARPLPIEKVRTWAYQLQGLSEPGAVEGLAESAYDMLVVEPTCTDWSSGDRDFDTKEMVERLQGSVAGDGLHRKLVLAYIDIGEAEDWRWYWTWSLDWEPGEPFPEDWPDFILAPDPDGWEGDYPVAYWDPAWKDIIIYGESTGSHPGRDYRSALDEILAHGFDGVYLDWVEGYEDPDVEEAAEEQGLDPVEEMAAFIEEIGDYGRGRNTDFLVVQQNAAALIEETPQTLRYIDAIAQEAIWYDGTAFDDWDDPQGADVRQDPELTEYYLELLVAYKDQGLPVFDCEYAVEHAGEAYALSRGKGFVPYCTRRPLSRLTTTLP